MPTETPTLTTDVCIVHAPSGVTVFIGNVPHALADLALLREVYDLADEQRIIIREVNRAHPRDLERLTQQARLNWRSLAALLEAMALDRRAPALAVGQQICQLRQERDQERTARILERNARALLDPLYAACAALADAKAWIEDATCEAAEGRACEAFDEAADAIVREVARLRAGETPQEGAA